MRSACCRQNSRPRVPLVQTDPASSSTSSWPPRRGRAAEPYTSGGLGAGRRTADLQLPAPSSSVSSSPLQGARSIRATSSVTGTPLVERQRARRSPVAVGVGAGRRLAGAQLLAEDPVERQRQRRASSAAAHRSARVSITSRSLARAARTDAERGESVSSASSPSTSPRPSWRDHRPSALVDDLEAAGAHDVQRVAGVALAEQPLAGCRSRERRASARRAARRSRRIESGEDR